MPFYANSLEENTQEIKNTQHRRGYVNAKEENTQENTSKYSTGGERMLIRIGASLHVGGMRPSYNAQPPIKAVLHDY